MATIRKAEGDPVPKSQRPVYFAESGGFVECPVYDRYTLGAGVVIRGPAIVEEVDSTTAIHPGYEVRVDDYGHMVLNLVDPVHRPTSLNG
jgi:N-methylhydantoinase A